MDDGLKKYIWEKNNCIISNSYLSIYKYGLCYNSGHLSSIFNMLISSEDKFMGIFNMCNKPFNTLKTSFNKLNAIFNTLNTPYNTLNLPFNIWNISFNRLQTLFNMLNGLLHMLKMQFKTRKTPAKSFYLVKN